MTQLAVQTIAIDGPVASGKTSAGRLLAGRLGFRFLDTGVMYRAIAWLALQRQVPPEDAAALGALAEANPVRLASDDSSLVAVAGRTVGPELRTPPVEQVVSLVAKASPVRRALVAQQRRIAGCGRIVMLGRDIGTEVLPDAGLKVYLQASAECRAQRRWQEMQRRGGDSIPDFAEVLADIQRRDGMDQEREDSPLRPADDAWHLNTDHLTIEQVVQQIIAKARQIPHPPPGG